MLNNNFPQPISLRDWETKGAFESFVTPICTPDCWNQLHCSITSSASMVTVHKCAIVTEDWAQPSSIKEAQSQEHKNEWEKASKTTLELAGLPGKAVLWGTAADTEAQCRASTQSTSHPNIYRDLQQALTICLQVCSCRRDFPEEFKWVMSASKSWKHHSARQNTLP